MQQVPERHARRDQARERREPRHPEHRHVQRGRRLAALQEHVALQDELPGQQAEQRQLQAQLTDLSTRQAELTELLGAPDVETKTQTMADGATVTLSYSVERGLMAVTTAGMPELSKDKGYELWLISADGAQPAGMLPGTGADGLKLLTGAMDGVSHFGITVEPATGSPAPTTEPLMVQEL